MRSPVTCARIKWRTSYEELRPRHSDVGPSSSKLRSLPSCMRSSKKPGGPRLSALLMPRPPCRRTSSDRAGPSQKWMALRKVLVKHYDEWSEWLDANSPDKNAFHAIFRRGKSSRIKLEAKKHREIAIAKTSYTDVGLSILTRLGFPFISLPFSSCSHTCSCPFSTTWLKSSGS